MTSRFAKTKMKKSDAIDYGFARARDLAYDAVIGLWERRKSEGMTQTQLASEIGRDPAWVSRYLRGPGNWTLKTIGAFIVGLRGEVEISVHALEDPVRPHRNFNAYLGYCDIPEDDFLHSSNSVRRSQPIKSEPAATSELPPLLKHRLEEATTEVT